MCKNLQAKLYRRCCQNVSKWTSTACASDWCMGEFVNILFLELTPFISAQLQHLSIQSTLSARLGVKISEAGIHGYFSDYRLNACSKDIVVRS